VAAMAVSFAVGTSLIGSAIAAGNVENDGGTSFGNEYRGLRGDFASSDTVKSMPFSSTGGRKRNRTRQLSSNVTSTIDEAGIPPLTSSAIQTLGGNWDDVPIVDGSLQFPSNQRTSIVQGQISVKHSDVSVSSSDFRIDGGSDLDPVIKPRIVGGSEDNSLDSFAMHLRYVPEDGMWKFAGCGGTLISKCHILTAGHCMNGARSGRSKAVYVNAWRPFSSNTDTTTGVTKPYHVSLIDLDKTFTHPQFNNTGNLNDIAVLTMKKCIPDDQSDLFEVMEVANEDFWRKRSSELLVPPNGDDQNLTKTFVAGFGQVSPSDTSVPPALQSVDVSLFGREDCEAKYNDKLLFSSIDLIQPDMYCAGAPSGGKDACLGDSGGPNYYTDPGTLKSTQLGIVSWGIGCAEEGFPGVYTSVAYHYDFIQNAVCGDERLGDFGLTGSNGFSQSPATAASPLSLCLRDDIPENNNAGGGEDPLVIGDNLNGGIKDSPVDEDVSEVPSCLTQFNSCNKDFECCGVLVCNKRDKVCKTPARQYKGRLADGIYGGSGSSQNIRNNGG